MLKKTIEYVDFNGVSREEDFYFHLSTPELTRMEAKYGGDLFKHIMKVVDKGDFKAVVATLEDLILTSYGEKTEDGRSFRKDPQSTKDFEYSNAYAVLFEELFTNPDASREFGEGVVGGSEVNKEKQEQIQKLRDMQR